MGTEVPIYKVYCFVIFKVVVSALLTNPSTVVVRGDGYYELQSTTCVYGILLISHHLSTWLLYFSVFEVDFVWTDSILLRRLIECDRISTIQ